MSGRKAFSFIISGEGPKVSFRLIVSYKIEKVILLLITLLHLRWMIKFWFSIVIDKTRKYIFEKLTIVTRIYRAGRFDPHYKKTPFGAC